MDFIYPSKKNNSLAVYFSFMCTCFCLICYRLHLKSISVFKCEILFLHSSQGVAQDTMGSSYCWDFFLAAFPFKSPQFQDSVLFDRVVCVRGVFSGMVVSVGGMSHGECLWRHLLFKHREHIMSIYDWSGAKLYDRRRWRDYVKCHTAREGTEKCGLFGCIYMGTLSWTAELFTMRKTVPVTLVGQTWCSQR